MSTPVFTPKIVESKIIRTAGRANWSNRRDRCPFSTLMCGDIGSGVDTSQNQTSWERGDHSPSGRQSAQNSCRPPCVPREQTRSKRSAGSTRTSGFATRTHAKADADAGRRRCRCDLRWRCSRCRREWSRGQQASHDSKTVSRSRRRKPAATTVLGGGLPYPRSQCEFEPLITSGRPRPRP